MNDIRPSAVAGEVATHIRTDGHKKNLDSVLKKAKRGPRAATVKDDRRHRCR